MLVVEGGARTVLGYLPVPAYKRRRLGASYTPAKNVAPYLEIARTNDESRHEQQRIDRMACVSGVGCRNYHVNIYMYIYPSHLRPLVYSKARETNNPASLRKCIFICLCVNDSIIRGYSVVRTCALPMVLAFASTLLYSCLPRFRPMNQCTLLGSDCHFHFLWAPLKKTKHFRTRSQLTSASPPFWQVPRWRKLRPVKQCVFAGS